MDKKMKELILVIGQTVNVDPTIENVKKKCREKMEKSVGVLIKKE